MKEYIKPSLLAHKLTCSTILAGSPLGTSETPADNKYKQLAKDAFYYDDEEEENY